MLSAAKHLQFFQMDRKCRFFAALRMTCFTFLSNATLM